MDINEYARRKSNILTRMLAALLHVFQQFLRGFMSSRDWDQMMHVSYRVMKPYRDQGTQLAREFFDSQRAEQLPDEERHDIFTDDYYPEKWFRQAMLPVFEKAQQRDAQPETLVEEAVARSTKVYEDGARRTLLQGIASDTSRPVRGFARFDPRPPTCAFCTMLISRGPVYLSKESADWPFGDKVLEKYLLGENPSELDDLMNRWHPKCTCIAVPVYKYDNYPTQEQEEQAFAIYDAARKAVRSKMRVGESKMNTRLILNEMRRIIYAKNKDDEVTLPRNVA